MPVLAAIPPDVLLPPGVPTRRPPEATPLRVPAALATAQTAAHRLGVATAAAAPPPGQDGSWQAFEDWAMTRFPVSSPRGADAAELAFMHQAARTRTPGGNSTAQWFAADGDRALWYRELRAWQRTVAPEQAAWGERLLVYARTANKTLNERAKQHFARQRPYDADPTLTTVVPRSDPSSKSYPSGHSARAFLDATILSHLMPERRQEFFDVAYQMAYSRVYGGAHYPSDTVGGAFEGGLVASWAIANLPRPS